MKLNELKVVHPQWYVTDGSGKVVFGPFDSEEEANDNAGGNQKAVYGMPDLGGKIKETFPKK